MELTPAHIAGMANMKRGGLCVMDRTKNKVKAYPLPPAMAQTETRAGCPCGSFLGFISMRVKVARASRPGKSEI